MKRVESEQLYFASNCLRDGKHKDLRTGLLIPKVDCNVCAFRENCIKNAKDWFKLSERDRRMKLALNCVYKTRPCGKCYFMERCENEYEQSSKARA